MITDSINSKKKLNNREICIRFHGDGSVYQCVSLRVLLPTDPSNNSPQNCHFGFLLAFEFPDL